MAIHGDTINIRSYVVLGHFNEANRKLNIGK